MVLLNMIGLHQVLRKSLEQPMYVLLEQNLQKALFLPLVKAIVQKAIQKELIMILRSIFPLLFPLKEVSSGRSVMCVMEILKKIESLLLLS